jgi:hypothetical protein
MSQIKEKWLNLKYDKPEMEGKTILSLQVLTFASIFLYICLLIILV